MKRLAERETESADFDHFESCIDLLSNASRNKDHKISELSIVDQEKSDLLHYIENTDFDLYSAWLAMKALQNCLRRRRKIKDELSIFDKISRLNMDITSIKDIRKEIDKLRDNVYVPRVLKQLFDDGGAAC